MSEKLVEVLADEPVADEVVPQPAAPDPAPESGQERRRRVSRWDRPPPPKDWRYVVGTIGRVLIVTGLLMFGFVAYQLWGTGIETARAQNALENTFEEQFELAVAVREADDADTGLDEPTSGSNAGPTDDAVDPDPDAASDVEPPIDEDETGDADEPSVAPGIGGAMSDVVPGGIDVSDDAVEQDVPVIPGEAFAKLDIDKIGIDGLYVVPGVKLDDLKKGPGHYPDTPLPGQLGNASLAGHRTTYGAPFFDLDQLEPGDEIVVTMVTGDRYVYSVTGSQVVTAADYHVITTRDPTVAELTLTTCDPKYTARNRLIVHSVLVPELSSRVGVAQFYDLDESEGGGEPVDATGDDPGEAIPGDDPTVTAPGDVTAVGDDTDVEADDETQVDTGVDTDDESSGSDPTDADAADGTAGDPVSASSGDAGDGSADEAAGATPEPVDFENAEIDAFDEGWFHDGAAWPQIALWAAVLVLIAVLAYQLAKRTRHSSIGVLVGIVPFVVALYFFYQNVNRLLPPGL